MMYVGAVSVGEAILQSCLVWKNSCTLNGSSTCNGDTAQVEQEAVQLANVLRTLRSDGRDSGCGG